MNKTRTVADPCDAYMSMKPIWRRVRAVCAGERFVKEADAVLDNLTFSNMLIPFSANMSQQQYDLLRAEGELPGIVAQFAKMLVGGLLRKTPMVNLPDSTPADATSWILNEFGQDGSPLVAVLQSALYEEIQTSRLWVLINYPRVENPEALTRQEMLDQQPYPVIQPGETVINWRVNPTSGLLDRLIIRGSVERYDDAEYEFHPLVVETATVHEIVDGNYRIRVFEAKDDHTFSLVDVIEDITNHGERLTYIPAWPLNGSIDVTEPLLATLVDKEIALYNKITRRNHLLYGAATYTPVISSDMSDEDFKSIVDSGLGSWIHLEVEGKASVLATPTDALADMDRAIAAAIEEMARLGVRMLTPENVQSGVALEIRNAPQTAQLGILNERVSATMQQVIATAVTWRYGVEISPQDVDFQLSADFDTVPLGADWLRLATEWYQAGLYPRSAWLYLLAKNELLPDDYNDDEEMQVNDKFTTPASTDTTTQVDNLKSMK